MPATTFKYGCWNGLAAEEFAPHLPNLDDILQNADAIVNMPDRIVRRIELNGAVYFAKSFLPLHQLKAILKRAVRRPIPFRLWQIHDELLAKNITCAKPMLAAINSSGEHLFICTEITFPTARILLKTLPAEQLPMVFTQAAKAIAQLHRAGFVHGDSIPNNICLDSDGTPAFIDNDRTAHIPPLFATAARKRNLIQFCSHTYYRAEVSNEHYTLFLVEYMKAFAGTTPATQTVSDFTKDVAARIAEIHAQKKTSK